MYHSSVLGNTTQRIHQIRNILGDPNSGPKEAKINIVADNVGSSQVIPDGVDRDQGQGDFEVVKVASLKDVTDEMVAFHGEGIVAVAKMDIEASECRAIVAAKEFLQDPKVINHLFI